MVQPEVPAMLRIRLQNCAFHFPKYPFTFDTTNIQYTKMLIARNSSSNMQNMCVSQHLKSIGSFQDCAISFLPHSLNKLFFDVAWSLQSSPSLTLILKPVCIYAQELIALRVLFISVPFLCPSLSSSPSWMYLPVPLPARCIAFQHLTPLCSMVSPPQLYNVSFSQKLFAPPQPISAKPFSSGKKPLSVQLDRCNPSAIPRICITTVYHTP